MYHNEFARRRNYVYAVVVLCLERENEMVLSATIIRY
eukprot:COSAG02_NODE_3474_length_6681_cov_29.310696_5_plen_37_part_00